MVERVLPRDRLLKNGDAPKFLKTTGKPFVYFNTDSFKNMTENYLLINEMILF